MLDLVRHTRLAGLLPAIFFLSACGEEIETDPEAGQLAAARISLAAAAPAGAGAASYRTYLYSERDVDVFSRLGSSEFFEEGATVEALRVEVGDRVRTGQLLAVLDDSEVQIQVDAAQAKADEATATYARIQELREKDLVSPSEYDLAVYAKRTADAELRRAKLDFSRTRVRAPFSGVVSRRYIRQGELIKGSTPLFRITALAPLRARVLVPEASAPNFESGAPVRLTGTTGETATAKVIVVSPTVDPGSGTREVIVELSEPNGFRPGASVTVTPEPQAEGKQR